MRYFNQKTNHWQYLLLPVLFFWLPTKAQPTIDSLNLYEKAEQLALEMDVESGKPYLIVSLKADDYLKAGELKSFWNYLTSISRVDQPPIILVTHEFRSPFYNQDVQQYFHLDTLLSYKWVVSDYWFDQLSPFGGSFLHYYDPVADYHYRTTPMDWRTVKVPLEELYSKDHYSSEAIWLKEVSRQTNSVNFFFAASSSLFWIVPVEGWKAYGYDRMTENSFTLNFEKSFDEWFIQNYLPLDLFQVSENKYQVFKEMFRAYGNNRMVKREVAKFDKSLQIKLFYRFGMVKRNESDEEYFGIYGMTQFLNVGDSINYNLLGQHPAGIPDPERPTHYWSDLIAQQDSIRLFAIDAFRQADSSYLLAELHMPSNGGLYRFIRFLPESFYAQDKWSHYKYLYRFTVPMYDSKDIAFILSNGKVRRIHRNNEGFSVSDTFSLKLNDAIKPDIRKVEGADGKYYLLNVDRETGYLEVYINDGNLLLPFTMVHSFEDAAINSGRISFADGGMYWITSDYFNMKLHYKSLSQ